MKRNLKIVMAVAIAALSLTACTNNNANAASDKDESNAVAQVENTEIEVNTGIDTGADTDTDDTANTENNADNKDPDNTSGDTDSDSKEDKLKEKIIAESGCEKDDIKCFMLDDFDGDGSEEAFAIIGNGVEEDFGCVINPIAYFVSDSKCEKLKEGNGIGFGNAIRSMTIGGIKYVMIDDFYVSENYSFVYYVSGGSVSEAEFSHIGSVWVDVLNSDTFSIINSSYDMMLDNTIGGLPIGHTWKKYYFFYSPEENKIYEYAGTSIDAKTVEFWTGRDLINELVPAGDTINDVSMRGNGLIAINYEHEEEDGSISYYHYIFDTLQGYFIDDNGKETNEEPLPGIYLKSLCPDMASYPEVPGPDGDVWYGD